MKNCWKRLLCLLLVCAMLCAMVPSGMASDRSDAPDYALADEIFEGVYAALRSRKAPGTDAGRAEQVVRFLSGARGVSEGSVRRAGDAVYWQTDDGITCHFSPHLYGLMTGTIAAPEHSVLPPEVKSATSTVRDIYLIAPYYGLDEAFGGDGSTYDHWTSVLAHFTGGRAYRLTQASATVDAVAKALTQGAVVLLDSHGDTETGDDDGKTSYLCLQSGEGITSADYAYDPAAGVCHACYGGSANGGAISYYEVDGTVLARHMNGSAPGNLIWSGTCFGMATQGFCGPLLGNGVAAMYGYSQAVSFGADRLWLNTTMDELTNGKPLAAALNLARNRWGCWDYTAPICKENDWPQSWINSSAAQAVSHGDAFPVLASADDPYPADPDGVQSFYSDWLLPRKELTLHLSVPDGVKAPDIHGFVFYQGSLPTANGIPRCTDYTGYSFIGWVPQPISPSSAIPAKFYAPQQAFSFGYDDGDPLSFGDADATLYALFVCQRNGKRFYGTIFSDGPYDPFDPSTLFDDMPYGTWYYDHVRFAVASGLVNGYSDNTFQPMSFIRRSEVVSILYRAAGSPIVTSSAAFSDVTPGTWFSDAVSWAVSFGIVQGYEDGTFRPNAVVSRAQLAAFFYRFSSAADTDTAALSTFPDRGDVPVWAQKEMAWAVSTGLINGNRINDVDYLQPFANATRAQFVTILERFLTT